MRELATQVGNANRRKDRVSGALGHLHARPGGAVIRAAAAAVECLGRGRGGTQHERTAIAACHLGRHLARMVARTGALLVAGLVFLIDNDEAQIAERTKERRTRADDHASRTAGDHVPLVEALTGREARVEDRDRFAKT